jgi:hypothetical protein
MAPFSSQICFLGNKEMRRDISDSLNIRHDGCSKQVKRRRPVLLNDTARKGTELNSSSYVPSFMLQCEPDHELLRRCQKTDKIETRCRRYRLGERSCGSGCACVLEMRTGRLSLCILPLLSTGAGRVLPILCLVCASGRASELTKRDSRWKLRCGAPWATAYRDTTTLAHTALG